MARGISSVQPPEKVAGSLSHKGFQHLYSHSSVSPFSSPLLPLIPKGLQILTFFNLKGLKSYSLCCHRTSQ